MTQEWGTIVMQSRQEGDMSYSINLLQLKPVAEEIFKAPYMNKTQVRNYRDRIFECIDWEREVTEPVVFYWDQDEFAFTMKESIKVVARRFVEGYNNGS